MRVVVQKMSVNKSMKKIAKLSVFFTFVILTLAILKSYLRGELSNMTFSGFIEAALISLVGGVVAGVALHIKDEKDKASNID